MIACSLLTAFLISSNRDMEKPRMSPLDLKSSNTELSQAFAWAKKQALSYVREGDPVGDWYEAALPGRQAFCMRDVSHQAAGAEALGLSKHNFNMLHKFAQNISESKDWCTFWEIDRLDRPAPVDYENDKKFWYTLPANFDVLDTCYRLFLWSGDRRYIDDPAMLKFYRHSMSDYLAKWDLVPERIMDRHVLIEGARGIPSYVESVDGISVGIDLLASQFAAFRSYSRILHERNETSESVDAGKEAEKVRSIIDSKWWSPATHSFYGLLTTKGEFTQGVGWPVLYWDAISDSTKLKWSIRHFSDVPLDQDARQVEDKSYRAEILYRYGFVDQAYNQILDLAKQGRQRREYPEVSFSIVGAIAQGLMGVSADATHQKGTSRIIKTVSGLNSKTAWAELTSLPIQGGSIDIRHEGNVSSTLKNHGPRPIIWRAMFPGVTPTLVVNGKHQPALHEAISVERNMSSIDVEVKSEESIRISVH